MVLPTAKEDIMNFTYSVNSVVDYQTFTGEVRTVRVTRIENDIKNGRSGFDGHLLDGPDTGMKVWGYDDQIVRVR